MKTVQESYKIDNADDLLRALLKFGRSEREVIGVADYDCLDVEVETLSDKSEVRNLRGRWFTPEQRRRESGQ